MLNCCIERKKARDGGRKQISENVTAERKLSNNAGKGTTECTDNKEFEKENKGESSQQRSWDSWSDSEDEFFECLSDTEELKENRQESETKEGTTKGDKDEGGKKDIQKCKPEGRLHQHGKLTLLHTGGPLYIPLTQVKNIIFFCICIL